MVYSIYNPISNRTRECNFTFQFSAYFHKLSFLVSFINNSDFRTKNYIVTTLIKYIGMNGPINGH